MNRALRRFYAKRWKNRVKRRVLRWRWLNEGDEALPRIVGIGAKARKMCSNYCCGSRRKYEGKTLKERRDYQDYLSQLEDLWITH